MDPSYGDNHYVFHDAAKHRKSLVSDVAYKVNLALPKGDWYYGRVHV